MLEANLKSYFSGFSSHVWSASELDHVMSTTPINLPFNDSDIEKL